MRRLPTALMIILCQFSTESCRTRHQGAQSKDFYANSRRRPASEIEKAYVARIEGCTGFFVQASGGRTLFMTARHCFKGDDAAVETGKTVPDGTAAAKKVCANPEWSKITDSAGTVFTCKALVAGDDFFHDVILFEFNEPRTGPALRLAAFGPAKGTRLQMIGFPGDSMNTDKSIPMTTENCRVYETDVESYWQKDTSRVSKDVSFRHDCSTYGGNSGGPMIIEGTDIVVGMPTRYDSIVVKDNGVINYKNQNDLSYGASLWDFAAAHRSKIILAGITPVASPPSNSSLTPSSIFSDGVFRSEAGDCLQVRVRYELGRNPATVLVNHCQGSETSEFKCKTDSAGATICKFFWDPTDQIKINGVDEFVRDSGKSPPARYHRE